MDLLRARFWFIEKAAWGAKFPVAEWPADKTSNHTLIQTPPKAFFGCHTSGLADEVPSRGVVNR